MVSLVDGDGLSAVVAVVPEVVLEGVGSVGPVVVVADDVHAQKTSAMTATGRRGDLTDPRLPALGIKLPASDASGETGFEPLRFGHDLSRQFQKLLL